ncbi:MAG: GNAT family N-acetyltransferase [Actinomycetota bacterium]|nr:GNAT family N-acetyltransferase [Actinomycetota bacterium]
MSGAPSVSILTTASLAPDDVEAWTGLADRAAEPNPFLRPEFVVSSAVATGEDMTLIRVRDGERWLALLPVGRTRRWRRTQLPVLPPWLPEYAYLGTPLVDGGALEPAVDALLDLLAGERRTTALVLHPFDPGGPLGHTLAARLQSRRIEPLVYAEFDRAALRRRPECTYLVESLSGDSRKKLRSRKRALGRELGGEPAVVDRSDDPAAWEAFLAMELGGWKGERGTALASDPRDAAFFRRMCAGMAARGHLQVVALEAGGRTASMQCNLVDGPALYGFKVAYDAELARFSPGALLEAEAIHRLHHEMPAVEFADSCADPANELINRIWPDRRRLQTLMVPTGSRRGRLMKPAVGVEVAVRRVIRRGRQGAAGPRAPGA